MKIDKGAEFLIETLNENGYDAYAFGDCIAAELSDRKPLNWHICTNADVEDIKAIFKAIGLYTIDTCSCKSSVGVIVNSLYIDMLNENWDRIITKDYSEPMIYNIDTYKTSIDEFLETRDFTINAIAFSNKTGIVDPYSGVQDIEGRIIRVVGDPKDSIRANPIRILKAVTIQSKIGYNIEYSTKSAMIELVDLVENIAPARKQKHLIEIITGKYVYKSLNDNKEIISYIIPELRCTFDFDQNNPHHDYTLYKHLTKCVEILQLQGESDLDLLLAAFLHDIAKPNSISMDDKGVYHYPYHTILGSCICKNIMSRLTFNRDSIYEVSTLIKYHDTRYTSKGSLKKFMTKHGFETTEKLLKLQYADIVSQGNYKSNEKIHRVIKCKEWLAELKDEKPVFSVIDLELGGNDLIKMGYKPGPLFRTILDDILDKVSNDELLNDKYALKRYVESKYSTEKSAVNS